MGESDDPLQQLQSKLAGLAIQQSNFTSSEKREGRIYYSQSLPALRTFRFAP